MRRRRRFHPEFMDAARWLPKTVSERVRGFVRFGNAGERIPRDGIFVLAWRALRSGELAPWQEEMIHAELDWFRAHMPVCNPRHEPALLFLRDQEHEMARHLWQLAHVLRELDVRVEMVWVRDVGRVVKQDAIQVAAVPNANRRGRA
jgi:hypothetical protein